MIKCKLKDLKEGDFFIFMDGGHFLGVYQCFFFYPDEYRKPCMKAALVKGDTWKNEDVIDFEDYEGREVVRKIKKKALMSSELYMGMGY